MTNPSFETGDMTGWTSYGYNPEGNEGLVDVSTSAGSKAVASYPLTNADGTYICDFYQDRWTGWWSHYNISQTVTLPAGVYVLSAVIGAKKDYTVTLFACTSGGNLYENATYNNTTSQAITSDEEDGVGYEKSVTFTSDGTTPTVLGAGLVNHISIPEIFFKADNFKLYRVTDVTSTYISNPGFEGSSTDITKVGNTTLSSRAIKDPDGWTVGTGGTYIQWDASVLTSSDAVYENTKAYITIPGASEFGSKTYSVRFHNSGDNQLLKLYQTPTLPAGVYTLSAQMLTQSYTGLQTGLYVRDYSTSSNRVGMTTNSTKDSWTTISNSFMVTEEASVELGIYFKHTTGSQLIAGVDNVTLNYEPFAETADYEELEEAIETVKAYTLGFDAGEYASYNVLTVLNAAKAIDSDDNNALSTVRGLIDALNAITANAAEVNAIYWKTDYTTDDKASDGYVHPLGWTNTGYNTRFLNKDLSSETVFPTIDHCIMSKFDTSYGTLADYKMPLKANTFYTLTFKYCGWGNQPVTNVIVKDGNGTALTLKETSFTPATSDGNSDATHWYDFKTTFRTNAAGNYTLELSKVDKTQQQIAWTNMNLVRTTDVSEVKYFLNAEIDAANATYNSGTNVGAGVFQIPTAAGNTFNTAINTTAKGVYNDGSATVSDVVTAIDNLKTAEETYASTTLNAPAVGTKYYIKVATEGHAKLDNAWLLAAGSTTVNNPTGYTIAANKAPAAYLSSQAFTFTQVSGNSYKISVDLDDTTVYLTNGTANNSPAEWKASQIQGTTDSEKAMALTIAAADVNNTFYIYNTETNSTIACQSGGNIYTEANNAYFSVEEVSEASVEVNVTAGKLATRIFPFTPTLPEGVVAYSCNGNTDNSLTLEEVAEPAANVPYILYSESGCSSTDLTGWGTATADTYTEGYLTGVFTRTEVPEGSYVLQTQGGTQAFYRVDDEDAYSSAYRVYVTVPAAGVKSFGFTLDDMETAIEAARAEGESTVTLRYNVAGQQMQNANKGLNIIKMADGSVHKVLVK